MDMEEKVGAPMGGLGFAMVAGPPMTSGLTRAPTAAPAGSTGASRVSKGTLLKAKEAKVAAREGKAVAPKVVDQGKAEKGRGWLRACGIAITVSSVKTGMTVMRSVKCANPT